jgi:DHA1 family bicyclomycin/chloramphenicol resistance-like MFS transporter
LEPLSFLNGIYINTGWRINHQRPNFLLLVSATYVGLFYDTANQMFCCCFLHCNSLVFPFGNLRAMAMEPGHIAGIAAAVTGFISTIMAVPISIFIGRFISDALPLFVGFSICAALSVCLSI